MKGTYVVQRAPSFLVRSCTGPIGSMVETDDHGISLKTFERYMRSSIVASELGSLDFPFNKLSSVLITCGSAGDTNKTHRPKFATLQRRRAAHDWRLQPARQHIGTPIDPMSSDL